MCSSAAQHNAAQRGRLYGRLLAWLGAATNPRSLLACCGRAYYVGTRLGNLQRLCSDLTFIPLF